MSEHELVHPTLRRIEATRLGSAAASTWRGAAYDRPTAREPKEWAIHGMALLGLAGAVAITYYLAYGPVTNYLALPAPESAAGALLGIVLSAVEGFVQLLLTLALMHMLKLLLAVVAAEWGGA